MPKSLELDLLEHETRRRVQLPTVDAESPHIVGTEPTCAVCVVGDAISPFHAELFCDGDHWCVRDLATVGGTFVDGNRLFVTPIRLEIGQTIRLGRGEGSVSIAVVTGAANTRAGTDVAAVVAGFVKTQKRERKKFPLRRRVALPSAGVLLVAVLWAASAAVVAHRRAALRADPSLATATYDNAASDRLAAVMAGEARPEDVNVAQIVKDASFGRTSMLLDAALDVARSTPGNLSSEASQAIAPAARSAGVGAHTTSNVDEHSLARWIAQRNTTDVAACAIAERKVIEESREITLRRLNRLLDERKRLIERAAAGTITEAETARALDIELRLAALGIDPSRLQNNAQSAGTDLASHIDPATLEQIRQKLVAAMSTR